MGPGLTPGTDVYLEAGKHKVFACAPDWPGWCRSAKTEQGALEALAAYAPRYSVVAGLAGVPFSADVADRFQVVERLSGTATTDFGAPDRHICVGGPFRLPSQRSPQAADMGASGGGPPELASS